MSMNSKPNVVVVICDDIGYADLSCYGSTMIKTPHLDALAADGARLTSMYSGGPTCSPSRAALLTGRVAPRTGVGRVLFPEEDRGLHPDEKTIANHLSASGYATGCFGKWHLGNMPERGPCRFGFDRYFGLPFSNDTPPIALYRDEAVIEEPADGASLTARYADEAIHFIDSVPVDRPFLCYVGFTMPHYPVTPEPAFAGKSDAGPYGDVCEAIDHHVGRMRTHLEQTGRSENTIFVFTSDHGPWFEGSTGGARGRKFETWDGGTRVPFLISWPKRILASQVIASPMATIDLLPTLCRLLDVEPDPDRPFDGEDILPTLTGTKPPSQHGPVWYFDGYALNAVRHGRWKLHRRRQTWGAERFAQMSLPQLFDLDRDRDESYDLSDRYPEIVHELTELMERFEASLDLSDDDRRRWWVAGDVHLLDADEAALVQD